MRRAETGFTLIELMVTLAVGSVVVTTIFGSLVFQQQAYMVHLRNAEAQQNARVAVDVLKRQLRLAGWGFAPAVAEGIVPIGTCNNVDPLACNDVDAGSDRLRIRSTRHAPFVAGATWEPGNSMFRIGPKTDDDGNPLADVPGFQIAAGTEVVVSGACKCPPDCDVTASDIITITGDVNDGQWHHKYQYSGDLSCTAGYDRGFNFGVASTIDLRVDWSDSGHPALVLDPDGDGPNAPMIVAYDVEQLQVRYGIDTSATPDRVADIWCDDPRLAGCATGFPDDRANLGRVVAARVAVVARTREPRAAVTPSSLTVFDHVIPGNDGYRRFVYRSTIALRNVLP